MRVLGQHAVKNDVVPIHYQLTHIVGQAGLGAAKLRVLYKRLGLFAQLLAKLLRPDGVVLGDVVNDVVQIAFGYWAPNDAIGNPSLRHRSIAQIEGASMHPGLEIGLVAVLAHASDEGKHSRHVDRDGILQRRRDALGLLWLFGSCALSSGGLACLQDGNPGVHPRHDILMRNARPGPR